MFYQKMLRPILFHATRHDPEQAHDLSLALLGAVSRQPLLTGLLRRFWIDESPALARTVCGIHFPNPLGLAAGYDKDGVALPALAALGFGFVEAGTVTWHAQSGNPRPRVFRLPQSAALINRMGFNNQGAPALAARLKRLPPLPLPIGISLGKSRRTSLEAAVYDYCASLQVLYPYGDYFAINISSPNTPGLRMLQQRAELETLLASLQREAQRLAQHDPTCSTPRPLLVKLAPDLSDQAILEVLDACHRHAISGIIATNTTIDHSGIAESIDQPGGLSGRPLTATALRIVQFISRETDGRLPIIGAGGIFSADDALRLLDAGASLLQVYTGFVYQGPHLIREINRALNHTRTTKG